MFQQACSPEEMRIIEQEFESVMVEASDGKLFDGKERQEVCGCLEQRPVFRNMFESDPLIHGSIEQLLLDRNYDFAAWLSSMLLGAHEVIAESPERLLYVDRIEEQGEQVYKGICQQDMEGIVAKPKENPYRKINGRTSWIKIKNLDCSQAEGKGELFHS